MPRKDKALIKDDEPQFEISSLVDVSFLLLIYFLVTSTILPKEKDLPMTLPTAYEEAPVEAIAITLEVKDNGSILMNAGDEDELLDSGNEERDIPITREHLQTLGSLARSTGLKVSVKLKVAEGANHQRFIDVLNCLRGENINSLTLMDNVEEL